MSWVFAAAYIIVHASRTSAPAPPVRFGDPALWLLAYAASFPFTPPIVHAFLGVSAVAALTSRLYLSCPFSASLWGLLLLGLPIEASLQFYLGYPLRLAATELSAGMLQGMGIGAVAAGAQLVWGSMQVAVDAPCSGVASLRMALVSCCALSLLRGLPWVGWATALGGTIVLAVFGNALRSASLFLIEARIVKTAFLADWLHAGVGLVVFAAVLSAQWWLVTWRAPSSPLPAVNG